MENNSKSINSKQIEPHEDLEKVVKSYQGSEYLKPYAKHTVDIFNKLVESEILEGTSTILDLGCGTAKSTEFLANKFKNSLVIGVDKSEVRLSKNSSLIPNMKILRADIIDLVRLFKNNGIKTELTCLFYPNPWPKKHHLKRRMHAHPFFGDLIEISSKIWHRTNWDILNQEFAQSYRLWTGEEINCSMLNPEDEPITNFEKKYQESGQALYEAKTF